MTKVAQLPGPALRSAALMAKLFMATLFMVAQFLAPASAETASVAPPPPAPGATCVSNDRFIVVSRSADAPGDDILARPAPPRSTPAACAFEEMPEAFRVARAGEAKYVLALEGNFLILDQGTGPSIRNLLLIDLAARRELWRSRHVPEPAPTLSGHSLVFHKYLRMARRKDCRNARRIVLQGLTPLYVVKGELSLPARIFTTTGQPRCIAGQ